MPEAQAPTERELRELAIHGETLRAQLSALDAQRGYVAELLAEARRSLQTLDHLAQATPDEELLIPLGGGAFVHGRLSQPGKVVSAIGSGVHAELAAADARERMGRRVESLEATATALSRDMGRVSDELARINAVVESYYGGA